MADSRDKGKGKAKATEEPQEPREAFDVREYHCRQIGCEMYNPLPHVEARDEHELWHEREGHTLTLICELSGCNQEFHTLDGPMGIREHTEIGHTPPFPVLDLSCMYCRLWNFESKFEFDKHERARHQEKIGAEGGEGLTPGSQPLGANTKAWKCRINDSNTCKNLRTKAGVESHTTWKHADSELPERFACRWYDCLAKPTTSDSQKDHESRHGGDISLFLCRSEKCAEEKRGFILCRYRDVHENKHHPGPRVWCRAGCGKFSDPGDAQKVHLSKKHSLYVRDEVLDLFSPDPSGRSSEKIAVNSEAPSNTAQPATRAADTLTAGAEAACNEPLSATTSESSAKGKEPGYSLIYNLRLPSPENASDSARPQPSSSRSDLPGPSREHARRAQDKKLAPGKGFP